MEKVSFWDEFWGRKPSGQKKPERVDSTEPPPPTYSSNRSLQEMISERVIASDKRREAERAEEERKKEEIERLRIVNESLPISKKIEDFLASASEKILETAEYGLTSLSLEILAHKPVLPQDVIENLKAYKALQTFCSKNGFTLTYSIRTEPLVHTGDSHYYGGENYYNIKINFFTKRLP